MMHRLARRAALPALLAAAAVTAVAGPAHAAGSSTDATPTAKAASATTYLPPGGQQLFSTWFWGGTQLCASNYDSRTGTLKVQSTSPAAGPEYVYISPGTTGCITRWWWGVPVWAINDGVTDLYVYTV